MVFHSSWCFKLKTELVANLFKIERIHIKILISGLHLKDLATLGCAPTARVKWRLCDYKLSGPTAQEITTLSVFPSI